MSGDGPEPVPGGPPPLPAETLARKVEQLQTLCGIAQQLVRADTPGELLDIFLPMAMEPLGVAAAYVALCERDTGACLVTERGFGAAAKERLTAGSEALFATYFPAGGETSPAQLAPRVLLGEEAAAEPLFPQGTKAVVTLPPSEGFIGLLGLGAKRSGEAFAKAEIEFLQGLVRGLATALSRTRALITVSRLNDSLTAQNMRLEQTLATMEQARGELDRRSFQLQTLYAASNELSAAIDSETLLVTGLRLVQEAFAAPTGFIVFFDAGRSGPEVAVSDPAPDVERRLADPRFRAAVDRLFSAQGGRAPLNMESLVVADAELLADLPGNVACAALFALDPGSRGLLGLGPREGGADFTRDERRLIASLLAYLMVSLDNARRYETISQLNEDLGRRNQELNRRSFQLKTLYDAGNELSGVLDSDSLLATALRLVVEAFEAAGGYIVLYADGEAAPLVAVNRLGAGIEGRLAGAEARAAVARLFAAAGEHGPGTMESQPVAAGTVLDGLPGETAAAVLFAPDTHTRGLIGLAGRSAASLSREEQRLMASLLAYLMVNLDNAGRFETIARLNTDLERRNEELKRTLDELTSAKVEIGHLQLAKERVLDAVRGGFARLERASLADVGLIVFVSTVLALLFNLTNPAGIELVPRVFFATPPPEVSVAAARAQSAAGKAVIVDARPAEFYAQEHIAGADNLPLTLFDFVYGMKLASLPPDTQFIVYGRTFSRYWDREVAERLKQVGNGNVATLDGGLAAWKAAGLPLAEGQ